ncbi:MAG: hypothetical protein ACXVI3_06195 [Halobacteriota archaeon]
MRKELGMAVPCSPLLVTAGTSSASAATDQNNDVTVTVKGEPRQATYKVVSTTVTRFSMSGT